MADKDTEKKTDEENVEEPSTSADNEATDEITEPTNLDEEIEITEEELEEVFTTFTSPDSGTLDDDWFHGSADAEELLNSLVLEALPSTFSFDDDKKTFLKTTETITRKRDATLEKHLHSMHQQLSHLREAQAETEKTMKEKEKYVYCITIETTKDTYTQKCLDSVSVKEELDRIKSSLNSNDAFLNFEGRYFNWTNIVCWYAYVLDGDGEKHTLS